MRCPSPLRLTILFGLALMSAGCARSMGKLDVDLTALKECRKLTPPLQVSEIESGGDYRALAAEAGGTISKGNKAIERRNRCDDGVIRKYGTAQGA
jgi:hypothetical protein